MMFQPQLRYTCKRNVTQSSPIYKVIDLLAAEHRNSVLYDFTFDNPLAILRRHWVALSETENKDAAVMLLRHPVMIRCHKSWGWVTIARSYVLSFCNEASD